jgi:hypothetical protein
MVSLAVGDGSMGRLEVAGEGVDRVAGARGLWGLVSGYHGTQG